MKANTATGLSTGQITLAFFVAVVAMLFAGFTAAMMIRCAGQDWSQVPLPSLLWWNTVVLMASSACAEMAVRRGASWLKLTLALGLVFLIGQLLAWRQLAHAGIFLESGPFGSFLYVLTLVHGLHLLGGLGAFLYMGLRRKSLRLPSLYWHFMGLVWLYLLYILNTL